MDFAEFYRATSPRTLRYAYGLTGDLPQAQDVVQEAYARAWQRWRQVSGYDDAEAWLRLVVTRLVFDWWRHLGVRRRTPAARERTVPPPSDDTVLLTTALRQLPEPQRRALALFYLLDLSVAEIAAETGVAEGTVKSWLSRGRAGLAEALRDEADAVPLPSADDAVERGRQRSRRRAVTTAAAAGLAVLLVAVLTAVLLQGHGPRPQPPQPVAPTTSPVAFSKLRPVGGTPIPVAAGDANAQTSIVDGRVFAGWRTGDGRLQVTAADLATGARLWPTTTLPGTFGDWNGLIGLPSATVLIGERDNGASPDKELFVVDPATGRLRWHIGMDVNGFDILAYRDVLVLADHDKNRTTAYAWTDGRVLWSFDGAITTVFGMHGPGDLDTSSAFYRPSVFGELLSGDTLFRLDPAGGITEYAVATGRPTGRTWSGIHIGDYLLTLAYDGVLYVVDHASLLAVRLDGGPALPAFTSETGNWLAEPVPCGTGRICVIDGPRLAGAEKRTEVVAIEHGRAVWRTPVPDATTLAPAGDHVLVETSGKDGQRTALLDAHGRPVLTDSDGLRYAMRVPGGLVLFAVDSVDPAGGPVAHGRLTGIDLATSRRTDLGTATLALIGASASRGYLVDTAGGLHIYRFLR